MKTKNILTAAAIGAVADAATTISPPSDGAWELRRDVGSFSIQYQQLPQYVGSPSSPNQFTAKLLKNLKDRSGELPMLRVGGTTQDDTVIHNNQKEAVYSNGQNDKGYTRPTQYLGPSFFDSFQAVPGMKWVSGLNLARQGTNSGDGSNARDSLLRIAQLTCDKAGSNLVAIEMGNEPDLFVNFGRRSSYSADQYNREWQDAVDAVRNDGPCKDVPWFGPSLTGPYGAAFKNNDLFGSTNWDSKRLSGYISEHNYMGRTNDISLQKDIMSHNNIKNKINAHIDIKRNSSDKRNIKYVLGETNSMYGDNSDGKANTLGAALWTVDFALHAAGNDMHQSFFHQALGNHYNSFDPNSKDVFAPYYGFAFLATFAGVGDGNAKISEIALDGNPDHESAYASYVDGKLKRVALINLNYYTGGDRNHIQYAVETPAGCSSAKVQKLTGPSATSTSGLNMAGQTFAQGSGNPSPASPQQYTINSNGGKVYLDVYDSEAAVVIFDC